jgi:hypothetical protein
MQVGVTSSNAGWTETRQYDLKRMQPTSVTVGSSLLSLAFYYCPGQATSCTTNNGNMASQTISHPAIGSEPALNLTQTYGYDALNGSTVFPKVISAKPTIMTAGVTTGSTRIRIAPTC